jgi:hypothetical protein
MGDAPTESLGREFRRRFFALLDDYQDASDAEVDAIIATIEDGLGTLRDLRNEARGSMDSSP